MGDGDGGDGGGVCLVVGEGAIVQKANVRLIN
jgi:hypothetical protein